MREVPLFLAGHFYKSAEKLEIRNPYSNELVALVSLADKNILESSVQKANSCRQAYAELSLHEISATLNALAQGIENRKEEFTQTIIQESGKPYVYARGETERAIETFRFAAIEATRIEHTFMDLSAAKTGKGLYGRVQYFSAGVIAGISPFNFPLNLVAHKIAPAIATKSPIILKPSSKTPLTALLLAELIAEQNLPEGAVSVLPCSRKIGDLLVEHDKIHVLSFTGSPEVGWDMKKRANKKRVVLELGGNAASIIAEDADLNKAVEENLVGAFAYSGQVCIHTQRIYVHKSIFTKFLEQFIQKTQLLDNLSPENQESRFSVMIDESNAQRVEKWIQEAQQEGAHILIGGSRTKNFLEPTVLTSTQVGMKIHDEEAFGPVVCINSYEEDEEAIKQVNDSKFGLQASLYTHRQDFIERCFRELEVGAVIVNKPTTFRVDQMPYGGIKDSGFGREGVKYAMMDFLEPKLLVHS